MPRLSILLDSLRLRLARPDALLWHALLGLLAGLVAGTVILIFRLAVEGIQSAMLPLHGENYEALGAGARLLLPMLGAALIAVLLWRFSRDVGVLGVARVMERMEYHQGYLGWRELVLQFLSAAIAIVSGHSVGREGPHVHLGAASASLFGQGLRLPNNSIRSLTACGVAAAIAASFNTPLAGVIFALEVLALDYSPVGFIPVMLAAVSANALAVAAFGSAPVFSVPPVTLESLADLAPVLLVGVLAGAVSAAYIQSLQGITRLAQRLALPWRLMLAGLIAGCAALLVPEVMGLGYDTLASLLSGPLPWDFLVVLLLVKLLATVCSIGLGVPGGTIGPALFLGAVVGNLAAALSLGEHGGSEASFLALLGMGAMMGASLQAPLAALTAIVELTHNPGVIMPGMLAIVLAALTTRHVFRSDSLFLGVLRAKGLDYGANPVVQLLRRSSVASVMNTRFAHCAPLLARAEAERLVSEGRDWIIIERSERPALLLPGIALATALSRKPEAEHIDLLAIPAERLELASVHLQATLQEALDILQAQGAEALRVERPIAPGIQHVYGVLTRGRIESAYRY